LIRRLVPNRSLSRQFRSLIRPSFLNGIAGRALAHFAPLPQKLLAARSGLARYGKNNIAYVPEFGSHHMLVSYYSSLPCVEETWTESLMLDACGRCAARRFSPGTHPVLRALGMLGDVEEEIIAAFSRLTSGR